MGTVLSYDRETWSTMRMIQDAEKWCKDRKREESATEHRIVLKALINSAIEERA